MRGNCKWMVYRYSNDNPMTLACNDREHHVFYQTYIADSPEYDVYDKQNFPFGEDYA